MVRLSKVHYKCVPDLLFILLPVEKMTALSKEVLVTQGGSPDTARLGFHWPPFHSISHLHLHIIGPESEMGLIGRAMFKANSFWFVSVSTRFFLFRIKFFIPPSHMFSLAFILHIQNIALLGFQFRILKLHSIRELCIAFQVRTKVNAHSSSPCLCFIVSFSPLILLSVALMFLAHTARESDWTTTEEDIVFGEHWELKSRPANQWLSQPTN